MGNFLGFQSNTFKFTKLPLVEILDRQRVLIENHLGIVEYSATQIVVKEHTGKIVVRGNGLRLAVMTKERLVIRGEIFEVSLKERDE